jgi:glycosyltransferase involved in cell wall biosynthesis
LDARFSAYAGIGRFVEGLWGGLLESGVEVVALWPSTAPEGWLGDQALAPRGEVRRTRARPMGLAEQVILPGVIAGTGAAVHHSPHLTVPFAGRVPTVLTIHDVFPILHPEMARSRAAALYYRVMLPAAARRARIVATVSNFSAGQVADALHLPPERVHVVEHGIRHDHWYPRHLEEVAGSRARHHLGDGYLLYVGTTKPHKNLRVLLDAYRPGLPGLVLAGPSAKDLDAALGTGWRSHPWTPLGRVADADLPALYSGAMATLLPSRYEAVGFSVLEAMACGCPVVCSNGGGLPETAGDAALLVPPSDVEAWRSALSLVVDDQQLREDLVRRGLERVSGRSWVTAAREYQELYRMALDG